MARRKAPKLIKGKGRLYRRAKKLGMEIEMILKDDLSLALHSTALAWSRGWSPAVTEARGKPGGIPIAGAASYKLAQYIYDEFNKKGEGRWPPKKHSCGGGRSKSWCYACRYPTQLEQYGNLDQAVTDLANTPSYIMAADLASLAHYTTGKVSGAVTGAMSASLRLGQYFASYPRRLGPSRAKGIGVGYVWLQEFGVGPAYRSGEKPRSFIVPALVRAANDFVVMWNQQVYAAKEVITHPKKAGLKPLVTTVSTRGSKSGDMQRALGGISAGRGTSAIVTSRSRTVAMASAQGGIPVTPAQRRAGLNWLQLLLWLIPTHKYVAILAAMKDLAQIVGGRAITEHAIRSWLQSMILGSYGMTIKSQRRSFRRKIYG